MTTYYVFNGDADGLCALQQLRLERAEPGTLVTGVKRDISLLGRVQAKTADQIIVLDVSLDKNRQSLVNVLRAGAMVRYFDHHHAGEIPEHKDFEAHLDPAPNVCTSILVDRYLEGRHRAWAAVGAFGDSLGKEGQSLAQEIGCSDEQTTLLQELGVAINYNAYGETPNDLHITPEALAEEMLPYDDPVEFAASSASYKTLKQGYEDDMQRARELQPSSTTTGAIVFTLPAAAWARRVSGTLANRLAKAHPTSAVAIVSPKTQGGLLVSLRVPEGQVTTADGFCRRFETGGGRKTAAGINHLPESDLTRFTSEFEETFGTR